MPYVLDETSQRAQIENLDVNGEAFCRAKRFDADETLKDTPAALLSVWRNAVQATVLRIEKRTGHKYTVECGEFRTQSRDIVACMAITRTE